MFRSSRYVVSPCLPLGFPICFFSLMLLISLLKHWSMNRFCPTSFGAANAFLFGGIPFKGPSQKLPTRCDSGKNDAKERRRRGGKHLGYFLSSYEIGNRLDNPSFYQMISGPSRDPSSCETKKN